MTSTAFPPTPEAVGQARAFVRGALVVERPSDLDHILLVVSELATNSVIHSGTEFEVTVAQSGEHVRIEISDSGAGRPTARHAALSDLHGRGLLIVGELADDWGVIPAPGRRGKTVWFTATLHGVP